MEARSAPAGSRAGQTRPRSAWGPPGLPEPGVLRGLWRGRGGVGRALPWGATGWINLGFGQRKSKRRAGVQAMGCWCDREQSLFVPCRSGKAKYILSLLGYGIKG